MYSRARPVLLVSLMPTLTLSCGTERPVFDEPTETVIAENRADASATDAGSVIDDADSAVPPASSSNASDNPQSVPTAPPVPNGTASASAGTGDAGRTSDCVAGFVNVNGSCVRPTSSGGRCSVDTECASGHCVSGICCKDDCSPNNNQTCGWTGVCGTDGECRYASRNTRCTDASCANGQMTEAAFCDGDGRCDTSAADKTFCGGHICEGDECATRCSQDSDCLGDGICKAGECTLAECTQSSDCSTVTGLDTDDRSVPALDCQANRCERNAIVAHAIPGCESSVTAEAGTPTRPYCTPQLAVSHALTRPGPKQVILRGSFTSGTVISGDIEILGDESAPARIKDSRPNGETAFNVQGEHDVRFSNLEISDWENGILFEAGRLSLRKVEMHRVTTFVNKPGAGGTITLENVTFTGGTLVRLVGDIVNVDQITTQRVSLVNIVSPEKKCSLQNSEFMGGGQPSAVLTFCNQTEIRDNAFSGATFNSLNIGILGENPTTPVVSNNQFQTYKEFAIECTAGATTFTGNNTFDEPSRATTNCD